MSNVSSSERRAYSRRLSSDHRPRGGSPAASVLMMLIAVAGVELAEIASARSQAITVMESEQQSTRHVVVAQFKSKTVRFDRAFLSTVVGAPDIADVLPVSDRLIYIQGKKIGTTNIAVFDKDKNLIAILDVEVAVDTQSLAAQIRSGTGSTGIHVGSNNGQVILTGVAARAFSA
jgi:pilus assembly protein CpaC